MEVEAAKPRLNDNVGIGRKDRKLAGRIKHSKAKRLQKKTHTLPQQVLAHTNKDG